MQCVDEGGFHFERWAEQGLPKVTPLWLLKYLPNMPASHIAIYNDLRGPNNSITLREASANLALAEAFCTIARDSADTIVVGATGTRIHPIRTVHVALQEQLARGDGDPTQLSRPFDRDRCGLVLGEGAGAVVLEELQTAQARGASILGEIIGYGSSAPHASGRHGRLRGGRGASIASGPEDLDLAPAAIGHLHAHGAGTTRGDAEEAQAISRVFGSPDLPGSAGGGCEKLLWQSGGRRRYDRVHRQSPGDDTGSAVSSAQLRRRPTRNVRFVPLRRGPRPVTRSST